ncbi:hypothetical protein EGT07_00375 [Herbaspirillum sp. HC18]|nr:hypothetical protein EGT07_00375 [Herbaspirillum sp. HC18]
MLRLFSSRLFARRAALALLFAAACGAAFAQTGSSATPTSLPCPGGASGTGAACSPAGGVATVPTAPTPDPDVGNPINLLTGNKYQREVDLPALPGVLGLEIVRHYNSHLSGRDSKNGLLGRGWKLSYETELSARGRLLDIVQADGSRIGFSRDLVHPQRYHAATPWQGQVFADKKAHGTEYTWVWPNGRQLNFNVAGKLVQIAAPTGEFVSLQYDAKGLLVQVTDPQGRRLHLNYLDKKLARAGDRFRGVQSIDSPLGRFSYAYGSELPPGAAAAKADVLANLVKVGLPTHHDASQKVHPWANRGVTSSSISRLYHYEDARYPTLLTGISVHGQGSDGQLLAQRLSTYGYDAQGRANLSVKGAPLQKDKDGKAVPGTGLEQVTLAWPKDGTVVLTNSLSQRTTYQTATIAGEPRILEARGPGCSSCGPGDRRYAYDEYGRLTGETVLGADGAPVQTTRTTLDGYGRALEIGTISYRNGQAQPAQWQVRYRYPTLNDPADALQRVFASEPSVISRPSVVPGKEHQIRIDYNAAGQPVSVTESGWVPSINGSEATEITRTTTYRYATVNGRSVLAEIDGPLKNGPKNSPDDSDITRLIWDGYGNAIIAMAAPGGFASSIVYDEAGRLTQVRNAEGLQTTFAYDARSQLISLKSTGPGWDRPRATSYLYDALGHRTETGNGSQADNTYHGQTKSAFDTLGRLLWTASAQGILHRYRYDSESRPIETSRRSGGIVQAQHYRYDAEGRVTQMWDDAGATTTIGYDAQGMPELLIDGLGRKKYLAFADKPNSKTPNAKQHGASVHHLRDDFGRTVATQSRDSGTTTRSFDEADHLVASTDALGNRARYEYDPVGRIARQIITHAPAPNGTAAPDTVTQWRYQGKRLVALEHPTQVEHYRYDQRGLRIARTVQLKQTDGTQQPSITHYRYDAQGAVQSVSLPDGSRIDYERNGQGQVTALKRSRIQTAWLQWLLPSQTLVSDLQRDLVGLRHYRTGNGIDADIQRSREGALARIVYRSDKLASTTANALDWLIHPAHASEATSQPAPRPLPGALGLPNDPNALLDWRYLWDAQGNLLHLQQKAGPPAFGNYAYDRNDRLIAAVQGDGKSTQTSRYFHDRQGRRLLSQQGIADQGDLTTNTARALYQDRTHRWLGDGKSSNEYDPNGQPQRIGHRDYRWDALGRLVEASEDGKRLARYTYNHRGERIAKDSGNVTYYLYQEGQLAAELDAQGNLRRQYVYLVDQPLAVIDTPQGGKPESAERDGWSRIGHDLATLWQAWLSDEEKTAWLHVNHLGAVEAATGQDGKLVWRARYQPFGKASIVSEGFALNLRLPGQYEDAETGLHYNRHRYYDPQRGTYLTPDPLDVPDGPNPYAYVRGNPLKYIDPSGLILFAFDGTENTDDQAWLADHHSSLSNVVEFRNIYDDGNFRYITGVGTVDNSDPTRPILAPDGPFGHTLTPDKGFNYSGPARITRMIEYFGKEADLIDDTTVMDVDIIGFSRGAAEARDFANQIVANTKMISGTNTGWYSYKDIDSGQQRCQKVNFRFMGLWDTVLSTNHSGHIYNLSIPTQFAYVAQAVALNEYRGNTFSAGRPDPTNLDSMGAFPLESIKNDANATDDQIRVEQGFIGAHADIGGGFENNDLSKVALVWMLQQADKAGVKMKEVSLSIIANPVLHDKSNNIQTGLPNGGVFSEDRTVRYRNGSTTKQRAMGNLGMSYADTNQFITYTDRAALLHSDLTGHENDIMSNETGTVDMHAYLDWLNATLILNGGQKLDLTVQP